MRHGCCRADIYAMFTPDALLLLRVVDDRDRRCQRHAAQRALRAACTPRRCRHKAPLRRFRCRLFFRFLYAADAAAATRYAYFAMPLDYCH